MSDKGHGDLQSLLVQTGASAHPRCFCCGREHPAGLRLEFRVLEDGSVTAGFECGHVFESYPETLHGGMVAALLDSAMTNCLFSRGVTAVTAELRVRFLVPARPDRWMSVSASLVRARPPLYHLSAELVQDGAVVARARARFMCRRDRPPVADPGEAP